ncbi:DUF4328 domain-containing protein [Streptomyces sp. NPDC006733]|uniref:DUF4328 domain-containing protein n=1 Tax=Streptomyces sp. NPDC006733 TaxID=3155460 RepID=UPI0033C5048A
MKCANCGLAPAISYDGYCENCSEWGQQAPAWPAAPAVQYSGNATYKDPGGLAVAVIVLLACGIAVDLYSLAAAANRLLVANALLSDPFGVSDTRLDTADGLYALSAALQILALLVTGVLFIVWFSRVRVNAEYFDAAGQRKSRGWAVGAWFTPVVNLWFPKQIANDIWDASTPSHPDGSPARAPRTLLNVWWTLWVTTMILDRILSRLFDSDTAEALRDGSVAAIINDGVSIAAAVFAILVVRKLSDRQRAKVYYGQTVPYGPAPVSSQ